MGIFAESGGLRDRFAYRAQQASLLHLFLALHRRWGILRDGREAEVDGASANALWRRYSSLLERDLLEVREGSYPRALLFDVPYAEWARVAPRMLENAPAVWARRASKNTRDLPEKIDLDGYPAYYRRNFHWQTDGYLSRRSAEHYDAAVEMLFFGTADVMRRQIIPPITKDLRRRGATKTRLLDVGAGTGRALKQLAQTHPRLSMVGVDLSPFYVDVARERLAPWSEVTMLTANAEALPFRDAWFDVVTSIYLFHELPRAVRRTVVAEMARVVAPGGLVVIEDSAQLVESSELVFFMNRFAAEFHEPFFLDYVEDDLAPLLADAGLDVVSVEPHFISKVVVARKRP
ncbi:class I SAM-dependent methyltransferase [Myxococcota bacterium]|nr:class I SAM-dependent methyltransferase [Myxococcota bacterium]